MSNLPAGVIIELEGGNCPVQIEGTVDGTPFYFRARHNQWTMSIGLAGDGADEWSWQWKELYRVDEKYSAGWMELSEARDFAFRAIERWRNNEDGSDARWKIYDLKSHIAFIEEVASGIEDKEALAKLEETLANIKAELQSLREAGSPE